MIGIYGWLGSKRAIGLQHTVFHAGCHVACRVPDVNLPAVNIKGPTIQRGRFSEAGDGMFGRRIRGGMGSGGMCRNRAVVDDASAARLLLLHEPDGVLRA